jgi:hypothetical protein
MLASTTTHASFTQAPTQRCPSATKTLKNAIPEKRIKVRQDAHVVITIHTILNFDVAVVVGPNLVRIILLGYEMLL